MSDCKVCNSCMSNNICKDYDNSKMFDSSKDYNLRLYNNKVCNNQHKHKYRYKNKDCNKILQQPVDKIFLCLQNMSYLR